MSDNSRAVCVYSGSVHGVGFRWRTLAIAREFEVTGYVKNLRDKKVELVAEGDREEVQRFLMELQKEMVEFVTGADLSWDDATGEFEKFAVKY